MAAFAKSWRRSKARQLSGQSGHARATGSRGFKWSVPGSWLRFEIQPAQDQPNGVTFDKSLGFN
jgi:hypothetical protein